MPDGMNTPASFPSSAATRSQSASVVGSESDCSSPTTARAMASRIPAVGRVWVSLNRSIVMSLAEGSPGLRREVIGRACATGHASL